MRADGSYAFSAEGDKGQYIYVSSQKELVIIRNGIEYGTIMIQGTGSHIGKSVAVAAIYRILKQDDYSACPFKSQNRALDSFVTSGGDETGRAQVVQAEAAGLEPGVIPIETL